MLMESTIREILRMTLYKAKGHFSMVLSVLPIPVTGSTTSFMGKEYSTTNSQHL